MLAMDTPTERVIVVAETEHSQAPPELRRGSSLDANACRNLFRPLSGRICA